MIEYSIIIPAHNAAATIGDCIESLQNQTVDRGAYEIIVVDDGSNDGTAEIATQNGARVIRQDRAWPAAARNAGIAAARGEIVCFTDADCIPQAYWLEALSTPLIDPDVMGSKGTYLTDQRELVARFVQLEYEDKYDLLKSQEQIDFIDTYSAAYRRSTLIANNCFDERFLYLEDQELSFRLAARGYKMIFVPDAAVRHQHSASAAAYFSKKMRIGYWKAQVVRRFPERGVRDSHTPQVMKFQMLLIAALLVVLAGAILTPWLLIAAATLALVFAATTLPFAVKAWSKDRVVGAISPALLAVRALALGLGYGWGTLRPRPGISGEETTIGGISYLLKRAMDIIGGIAGLLILAVLGPVLAVVVRLTSDGPILYKQGRVGQGGRPFTIYKFRSMRSGAEAELDELLDFEALVQPSFKFTDDPRVTPVGRFLRRWSLDELPQFWNVMRGDMSLIGPRPEETRIVALYSDWHRRRLSIKPGLTGPMQVNGRGDLSLDERVRLELEYIENYSILRDLDILVRTFPAIISGRGAR